MQRLPRCGRRDLLLTVRGNATPTAWEHFATRALSLGRQQEPLPETCSTFTTCQTTDPGPESHQPTPTRAPSLFQPGLQLLASTSTRNEQNTWPRIVLTSSTCGRSGACGNDLHDQEPVLHCPEPKFVLQRRIGRNQARWRGAPTCRHRPGVLGRPSPHRSRSEGSHCR